MRNTGTIYALRDPDTKEVRYVGQTSQKLNRRFRAHIQAAKTAPGARRVCSWISGLQRHGLLPEIIVLAEIDTTEMDVTERDYIAFFNGTSNRLCNLTDGGLGVCGYKQTPESVRKRIASRAWYVPSEETKKKASDANKAHEGHKRHADRLRGYSRARIGTKQSPEYVEKRMSRIRKIVRDNQGHIFPSAKAAAEFYGADPSSVTHILKGRRPCLHGCIQFKYLTS